MYRIRLASGVETTYHHIDELTGALQDGTVTAQALIYHQRADRWLSITNHPHYQIALSRASGVALKAAPRMADGPASKRQVVSAVKPAPAGFPVPPTAPTPDSELPPTAARSQLLDAVAELSKPGETRAMRKLSIPAPRKPEATPLRAHENVLEGVVIERAEPRPAPAPAPRPSTPKPVQSSGTQAMPVRIPAPAPAPAPAPRPAEAQQVPDLGDGLDLVEVEEPKQLPEVEVIDLAAPLPRRDSVEKPVRTSAPSVAPILDSPVAVEEAPVLHHEPVVTYRRPWAWGKIGGLAAGIVILAGGIMAWKPWGGSETSTQSLASLPRTEAFGGSSAQPQGSEPTPVAQESTPSPVATPAAPAAAIEKPVDSAPAIVRVAAPRTLAVTIPTANLETGVSASRLEIPAARLIQQYNAAYTEARSELELRMLQIGFTQIFLRTRMTTPSGIQDTRRLVAAAATALRQYRSEESRIERAYQDTIGVAGRNLGWGPRDLGTWNARAGQRETAETQRLTTLLLNQVDSTFSLLAAQEGKFQVNGDAITFSDPAAASAYSALRVWLNQQADKYAGSGDALPATLRQVVKAIGTTRLPVERK